MKINKEKISEKLFFILNLLWGIVIIINLYKLPSTTTIRDSVVILWTILVAVVVILLNWLLKECIEQIRELEQKNKAFIDCFSSAHSYIRDDCLQLIIAESNAKNDRIIEELKEENIQLKEELEELKDEY